MPAYLDTDLLARFESALRSAGAAVTGVWAPGLSDAEIDAAVASTGLTVPEEARRWWRWHDGTRPEAGPAAQELMPDRPLFDLATALEQFRAARATTQEVYGREGLLMPVGDQPWLFFDCSGDRDAPVPVLVGGHGQDIRPALPSIGALVEAWTELIETRVFTTDAEGHWEWDFEKVPEAIRQLGVY